MKTRTWENEIVDTPIKDRWTTDYLYLLSKGVSPAQRKKFDTWNIFINWAICLHCKDFIRSMNRHDFKYCSCEKVAVDWGSWYCRRIGNPEDYIDVIETFTYLNKG